VSTNERRDLGVDEITFEPNPPMPPPMHTWQPVDLVAAAVEPPEPPEISGLLYPGKRHVFSGESEAGKSFLMLAVTSDELTAGHGVVWVDTDNMGDGATLERLRSLGVDDRRISELFAFMQPAEPLGEAAVLDVTRWLGEHDGRLIVFDAFNATLSLHGLDPNSTADVEKFWQRVVDPFTKRAIAAALPDHVVKKPDERGKYAYGSERKHTGAEVHIGLKAIDPFGRGRTGKAKLTVHKDRPGFHERPSPLVFVLVSDADTGLCTWKLDREATTDESGGFRPTNLMEKVSDYLRLVNEPVSRSQIVKDVHGKTDYVRVAMDALLAEGYASEVIGDRGARLLKLDQVYREDNE
jgi:hypothetical protein